MSVSLQRLLKRASETWEHRFLSRSIQVLATGSGRQVELKNWMITSFEVEFGSEIGRGGLCVHLHWAQLVSDSKQSADAYSRAGGTEGMLP
jgi:hypothetical protein